MERHAQELAERIAALEHMRRELLELAEQVHRQPRRADSDFCHIIEAARPS